MKLKLKKLVLSIFAAGLLVGVPASSALAAYNPLNTACQGVTTSAICKDSHTTSNPVTDTITKAANIVAIVAALGAVINIIIGAFEFVTAGGTGFKSASANPAPTKAAKARSRVTSGLIGLLIVALAWTIVRFIIDRVIR